MQKVGYLFGLGLVVVCAVIFGSASFASTSKSLPFLECPELFMPLSEDWESYYTLSIIRYSEAKQTASSAHRITCLINSVELLERAADLAPGLHDSALQLPISCIYKQLYSATGDPSFAKAAVKCLDRALKIYPENSTARSEREVWLKIFGPFIVGEDVQV